MEWSFQDKRVKKKKENNVKGIASPIVNVSLRYR